MFYFALSGHLKTVHAIFCDHLYITFTLLNLYCPLTYTQIPVLYLPNIKNVSRKVYRKEMKHLSAISNNSTN